MRLLGARVDGQLDASDATLINESGPALAADNCQVGGDVVLTGEFLARGTGELGALRLSGVRISGQLNAKDAKLVNESGPALEGGRCQVGGDVFLTGGFLARGAGQEGALRLPGVTSGNWAAAAATLVNESGPALVIDGEIGGGVILTDGFTARGGGEFGAVRLLGARISGQLNAKGAMLVNESGPALIGDYCEIGGSVYLNHGFSAHGAGELEAVRLSGARITGQFSAGGAELTSTAAGALCLYTTRVDESVLLIGTFAARGAGNMAVVNLVGARLGSLQVNDGVTHADNRQHRWQLDGCTFTGLPRPDDRRWWLRLLANASPVYAAQPYQQLAAMHRAAGHDRDMREVLIAQRRDQICRGQLSGPERTWARFTGLTLGYGWKPWRALYWLGGVAVASVALAVMLGGHGALIHPPRPGLQVESCTLVERVGVGLDLGTPLLGTATKARERCPINPDPTSTAATTLIVSTWVLQLAAWSFAALFVAGFTSAVRKT